MSAIDPGDLALETSDGIALLTIQGEERHNAQRRSFWPSLRAALQLCEEDATIGAIVITGSGNRAFSAGGDIVGYKALTSLGDRRAFILDCLRTFRAVESSPKPVIAAVNGIAVGGGCELVLACDFALASQTARFGVPEATLGLMPGFGVTRLRDVVGPAWARYLAMTGELVDAATAERIGLVQETTAPDHLLPRAFELAAKIRGAAPIAVSAAKYTINGGLDQTYFDSLDAVVMLQGTSDAAEGIAAFEGKRPPKFEGR